MSIHIVNYLAADKNRGVFHADSNSFTGCKVLIHNPSEFPDGNKKGIFIGAGKVVSIALSAQTVESTAEVRATSPERRKCLRPSETDTSLHKMSLFSEYKKSSCHFENTAFGLLKEFKCLPYFMPTIPHYLIADYIPGFQSNDSITCDGLQMKAMAEKIAFFSARPTHSEDNQFIESGNPNGHTCPDECDSTEYTYQVSYADFEDNGNFFFQALLRKGNKTVKAVNRKFFAEYERFIWDTCMQMIKAKEWNGTGLGQPIKTATQQYNKKNCV